MGVEYRNYLVPRDQAFSPEPHRIVSLVERLRVEQWVLTPASAVWEASTKPHQSTGGWSDDAWLAARRDSKNTNPLADELALRFYVYSGDGNWPDAGMPYPLAYGEDEDGGYHDIVIYAARDFVVTDDWVDDSCACGTALGYEVARGTLAPIDMERRVRSVCSECSQPFSGSDGGDGIAFRFAVVVDCGKGWPVARRVGEPAGLVKVIEAAGYNVANPPAPRERGAEDSPSSPNYDREVLRSAYGDPAPPIADAFLKVLEATIGTKFDSIPEFY